MPSGVYYRRWICFLLKGYGERLHPFFFLRSQLAASKTGIRDSPDTSRLGLRRNDLPKKTLEPEGISNLEMSGKSVRQARQVLSGFT